MKAIGVKGDLSNDLNFSLSDLLYLAKHLAGKPGYESPTEGTLEYALYSKKGNLNEAASGDVTISDLKYMAKTLAKAEGYVIEGNVEVDV